MSEQTLDLAGKYEDTTLSNYEVFMMGEAFYNWIGTTIRLGHTSPGMTLDYTTSSSGLSLSGLMMRDFVAWTSHRNEMAEGCEDRLRELADKAGLDGMLAARVGRILDRALAGERSR